MMLPSGVTLRVVIGSNWLPVVLLPPSILFWSGLVVLIRLRRLRPTTDSVLSRSRGYNTLEMMHGFWSGRLCFDRRGGCDNGSSMR
jgi:hypothetical protein